MPAAARISDMHTCPKAEPGPVPHVGGPVSAGAPTVLLGLLPAARVGDVAVCVGPPDAVKEGEPTVLIAGQPAARLGDPTTHGGAIAAGCPSVLIGASAQVRALRTNKPICEDCERKKRQK